MIKFLIALALQPILVLYTYFVFYAIIHTYEEVCNFIKTSKRKWNHFVWEVKWEWKRFRKEVNRWTTRS